MTSPCPLIGWREYITFPTLDLPPIKAKIDTGARSSALHATNLTYEERESGLWVRFTTHPKQKSTASEYVCVAPVLEQRQIRSSSGQQELRPVIRTDIQLGDLTWPIELTLTQRNDMKFRMLLGREAIRNRFWVAPGQSYLQSQPPQ